MRTNYQRLPFQLHATPDKVLLFSTRGVAELTDSKIISFIQALGEQPIGKIVCGAEMTKDLETLKLPVDEALRFLTRDVLVIREVPDRSWRWSAVRLITDFSVSVQPWIDDITALTGLPCDLHAAADRLPERVFLVVLLERYDQDVIKRAYEGLKGKDNSAILSCYFFDRTFLIDGLWISGAYLPCHFCHMERMRVRKHQLLGAGAYNWVYFDRLAQGSNWFHRSEIPLTEVDRFLALATLRNRVKYLIAPAETYRQPLDAAIGLQLDLDEGVYEPFQATLWELCDCIAA
jgi:McbB family protein